MKIHFKSKFYQKISIFERIRAISNFKKGLTMNKTVQNFDDIIGGQVRNQKIEILSFSTLE